MARRLGLSALVLVVVVGVSAPARAADDDELPIGGIKFAAGLRQGLGELGDAFSFGWLAGLEANYHPTVLSSSFSFGVAWSIYFGRFGAGDSAVIDETLKLVEMSFGLRVRRRMSAEEVRFISLGSGVTIMRTNLPVPPKNERLNTGPYIAMGIEQYFKSDSALSFSVRYGLVTNGPASLSIILGVTLATK